MGKNVFDIVASRYPQILLPIRPGEKNTEEFKDAVFRGNPVANRQENYFSDKDTLERVDTPAGSVEVLCLRERDAFVHTYRALAYRCEPTEIPDSVGAGFLSGLINWEKIHRHKEEYLASGGTDWGDEFGRFTSDKANYLDTIVILSSGPYSAVPASEMGLAEDEWIERSIAIRKYHELTHFVCRKQYPKDIQVIRDEVLADAVGLIAAFGSYDPGAALKFLGIEENGVREGGRLLHYSAPEKLEADMTYAKKLVGIIAETGTDSGRNALERIPVLWDAVSGA